MRRIVLLLAVLALALTATDAVAGDKSFVEQYRGPCPYNGTATVDPIGKTQHSHDFFGAVGVTNDTTYASLRAGETTCRRPDDKSAYWAPSLKWGGETIRPGFSGFYFQPASKQDGAKVLPFPKGFQMIANENNVGRVEWACTVQQNSGNVQEAAPKTCPDHDNDGMYELGLKITFGNCWDVKAATPGAGHSVKMPRDDGKCPDSHPRQLPSLIMWPDYVLPKAEGPVRVSMGHDEWGGSSYMHADAFIGFEDVYTDPCIVGPATGTPRPNYCDGNIFFK